MNAYGVDLSENFVDQLRTLGVEPPEELERLAEARNAIRALVASKPATDLHDEIRSGSVKPATFAKRCGDVALALLRNERSQELHNDLTGTLRKRWLQVMHDEADTIIAGCRPVFDAAAKQLVETFDVLDPGADSESVTIAAGPVLAEAWTQRNGAVTTLDGIAGAYNSMSSHANYGGRHSNVRVACFVASIPDRPALERATGLWQDDKARWARLFSEFTPQLNTFAEAEAIEQGATTTTDAAEAQARATTDDVDTHRREREAAAWKGFADAAGQAMS